MSLEQVIDALMTERLQRGWSLRDVAQRMASTRVSGSVHASHTIIYEYERGNRRPTVVALEAWANALGFDLEVNLKARTEGAG